MKSNLNPFCLSSFLTFRYVINKNQEWTNGWKPWWPQLKTENQTRVTSENEITAFLKNQLSNLDEETGILLSGGIDSAILASFMPKNSYAFTIRFIAEGAIDESVMASKYAEYLGLKLIIIDVHWEDFLDFSDLLMIHKKSPLHPIEPAIYKASKAARSLGIKNLVVGNGADSTFGGMDKLLSKDWSLQEFIKRYTFIEPSSILTEFVNMNCYFGPYFSEKSFDVQNFLKTVHGEGIIQTFCNGAETAGVQLIEPFELLKYPVPLDLQRIRNGESKYLLRAIFNKLYPHIKTPDKIPFARPMNVWLKEWDGPENDCFRKDINISSLSGDQKWLVYNLDKFIDLINR